MRSLTLVAVLVLLAAVGYLLLQPTVPSVPLGTPSEPLPQDPPEPVDPVLTQERLQQVSPPEQVESPPDGEDPPKAVAQTTIAVAPLAPLPSLNDSDSAFRGALLGLDPTRTLAKLLIDEELIRKWVVMVDNMAEGRIPRKHSLLLGPGTPFKATEIEGRMWLDDSNYSRYQIYLDLLDNFDNEALLKLYRQFYPLMQQAYAELGFPRRSFHQRLLRALDQVIDSPVINRGLELEQPSVMYKYLDPEIEQLSAVDKQLLRLGPDHARRVVSRVTQLRSRLAMLKQ